MRAKKSEALEVDEFGLPPVIHTETVCHLTGLSVKHLQRLVRENRLLPECKLDDARWRTTIALREIFGYYRRAADRAKPATDVEIERQQKLEDLRATKLKNAKAARDLLPRTVYVQAWGELLTTFKNRWLNFADKMAQRVFRAPDKVAVAEILEKEIQDIFAGLADPKVIEDIASKIRDDEFETHDSDGRASGDSAAEPADLV